DIDTADANYNRGNGLARTGDIEGAIGAYDRALELDPDHEDAIFNRDLLLQQPQPPEEQPAADSSQEEDGASGQSQQAQNSSDQPDQSQQSENSEGQPEESSQSDENGQTGTDPEMAEQSDVEGQPVLSPDDLEQWASEQAAEQWLRRIPQDPGGLLRRKFLYQYQRLGIDQDGNYVWPGDEVEPW
ncbi:MAG TPA: tetratricopeptide repeat protein, partial [Gemmatimonadetes bacterium]|nr:tetratricopeptide repeat protein [Gemmatimonadota bacterium]